MKPARRRAGSWRVPLAVTALLIGATVTSGATADAATVAAGFVQQYPTLTGTSLVQGTDGKMWIAQTNQITKFSTNGAIMGT